MKTIQRRKIGDQTSFLTKIGSQGSLIPSLDLPYLCLIAAHFFHQIKTHSMMKSVIFRGYGSQHFWGGQRGVIE